MSSLLACATFAAGTQKVWAAAVVADDDSGDYKYIAVNGSYGHVPPRAPVSHSTAASAMEQFDRKVNEKKRDYTPCRLHDPATGLFAGLVASLPSLAGLLPPGDDDFVPSAATEPRSIALSHLSAIPPADAERYFINDAWILTEKVNGERCAVETNGDQVRAFNRRGRPLDAAPASALALTRIGRPALFDGERGMGKDSGNYYLFDLLELDGTSIRSQPFASRASQMIDLLRAAGLVGQVGATVAENRPTVPGLYVLAPALGEQEKRRTWAAIVEQEGEGGVFRKIDGPSRPGPRDTPYERKLKLRTDVDAIVLGIKPGHAAGSLWIGLVRPSDQAVLEIGSVRSGLTDADVHHIGTLLASGKTPVISVEFLSARTVGYRLAEPTTALSHLRDDKAAADCTTDQLLDIFGPTRRLAIESAPASRFTGLLPRKE